MQWLQQHLTIQTVYIAFSAFLAVVIWLEGQKLKATKGKMPASSWFHLGSIMETIWFFVSGSVWYFFEFAPLAKVVPAVYMLYSIFGWIYGTSLMSKDGIPDSPEDLIIPKPYIAYSQAFALVFLLLCGVLLAMPFFAMDLQALQSVIQSAIKGALAF